MDDDSVSLNSSKSASRGIQTLFRSTFRTQINLIQIADNKANMIIGINTMVITVLMGIISTGIIFIVEPTLDNIMQAVPLVLVILTSLTTIILAARAVKPRILKPKNHNRDEKTSLLFFGNIYNMSLEDYLLKMDKLMASSTDIYQSMIIDIHNQAKVLQKKYELLRTAYLVFMVGFTLSIMTFLISWLLT